MVFACSSGEEEMKCGQDLKKSIGKKTIERRSRRTTSLNGDYWPHRGPVAKDGTRKKSPQ